MSCGTLPQGTRAVLPSGARNGTCTKEADKHQAIKLPLAPFALDLNNDLLSSNCTSSPIADCAAPSRVQEAPKPIERFRPSSPLDTAATTGTSRSWVRSRSQ